MKTAALLLQELRLHKLEVVLIDAPEPQFEGHKIRVATSRNPEWYTELYYYLGRPSRRKIMLSLEYLAENDSPRDRNWIDQSICRFIKNNII